MLTNAGPGVTGAWQRVEPSHSLDLPVSLFFINGSGAPWTAGNVNVELLINGIPGNGPQSPYPPQSDTGTVQLIAAVPPPAGSTILDITSPIEFIRCRTDPGLVGTVSVNMAES